MLVGTPTAQLNNEGKQMTSTVDEHAIRKHIGTGGLGHQPKSQREVTALMKASGPLNQLFAAVNDRLDNGQTGSLTRLRQDLAEKPSRYQPAPSIGLDNVGGLQGKEKKAAKATTKPISLSDWCDAIGAVIVIKRQPKKGSKQQASYTVYVEGLLHTLIYGNGVSAAGAREDLVQKLLGREKHMSITLSMTDAKGQADHSLDKELMIPRGLTV